MKRSQMIIHFLSIVMFTSKINFLFSNVKPRQKEFEFKIALDQKPQSLVIKIIFMQGRDVELSESKLCPSHLNF